MSCPCEPIEIVITSLGPQDDDLRVTIGRTVVYNPKANVSWYVGEQTVRGVSINPDWATSGFRVARINIERDVHSKIHCRIMPGTTVKVDTVDAWGNGWQTSQWRAEVFWSGGRRWSTTGGAVSAGTSVASNAGIPNYYLGGPYFETYIPNGEFVIPCAPKRQT